MAKKKLPPQTLIEKFRAIQAVGTTVEVPYHVWTAFHGTKMDLFIYGNEVILGDGDSKSIMGAREAIEWYAKQLGGTIKWE